MSPTFNLTCGVDGRTHIDEGLPRHSTFFCVWFTVEPFLPPPPHRRHAAGSRAFSAPPPPPDPPFSPVCVLLGCSPGITTQRGSETVPLVDRNYRAGLQLEENIREEPPPRVEPESSQSQNGVKPEPIWRQVQEVESSQHQPSINYAPNHSQIRVRAEH